MRFSLDVLRARKGDCLLLHYGTEDDPGLILIDGGPSKVYKPHLKPRLKKIRQARGLEDDEPLVVDLLMVSHIDDDHIQGILELTGELVTAKDAHQPLPVKIRSVWHNTFDDIIGNSPEELLASVPESFGLASANGSFNPDDVDPEEFDHHAAMVLASVSQGISLRNDLKKLQIPVNRQFGGQLVMADRGETIDLKKGLKVTVAGPLKPELLKLQSEHDEFLKKPKKTKAVLAAFADDSAANLSSLVVMAEVDGGRILLTGDARGDKILKGMEQVGLLATGGKTHVEVLKVPHHGSDRNMETGFFERVTADHYVFSGDGEHGNPERETFQMLLGARGDADFTVHLTYPVDEIDAGREQDWTKEQGRERVRKERNPKVVVREKWSPAKHSLGRFLAGNPGFAAKIRIVQEGKPHVIDLHEKLGF